MLFPGRRKVFCTPAASVCKQAVDRLADKKTGLAERNNRIEAALTILVA